MWSACTKIHIHSNNLIYAQWKIAGLFVQLAFFFVRPFHSLMHQDINEPDKNGFTALHHIVSSDVDPKKLLSVLNDTDIQVCIVVFSDVVFVLLVGVVTSIV